MAVLAAPSRLGWNEWLEMVHEATSKTPLSDRTGEQVGSRKANKLANDMGVNMFGGGAAA